MSGPWFAGLPGKCPGGLVLFGDADEHRLTTLVAQRTVGEVVAATDHAVTGDVNECHRAGFTGFEANRRSGRDVQPLAIGGRTIELQLRVGLDEVVVAADLDRPVTQVDDFQFDGLPFGIEFQRLVTGQAGTGLTGDVCRFDSFVTEE